MTPQEHRVWLNDLKSTTPCKMCLKTYEPIMMEFHHRDPADKTANVSKLINSRTSLTTILDEIDKCDLLCSNCHRKLSHESGHGKIRKSKIYKQQSTQRVKDLQQMNLRLRQEALDLQDLVHSQTARIRELELSLRESTRVIQDQQLKLYGVQIPVTRPPQAVISPSLRMDKPKFIGVDPLHCR
jgi:hypothetical protein